VRQAGYGTAVARWADSWFEGRVRWIAALALVVAVAALVVLEAGRFYFDSSDWMRYVGVGLSVLSGVLLLVARKRYR
jgi:hypothetical protein